jgi:regulatory protein
MRRAGAAAGPPPDAGSLQAAALAYLTRYAATEARLRQVLARRIQRWARGTDAGPEAIAEVRARARAAVDDIVGRLVASGAISDSAFADMRARALARAGRSGRAIGAHLTGRGVAPDLVAGAVPADEEQDFATALIHARKRRLGPWRIGPPGKDSEKRELASFARAGYASAIARRVLATTLEDAEAVIFAFRAAL